MGYYINSIYAVSPTDTHAFFIYFIPSTRDQYWDDDELLWVNEWMNKNFAKIAGTVGMNKGVIIAPSPNHDERYLESLLQVQSNYNFFSSAYPSLVGKAPDTLFIKEENTLHSGFPYIIFSHTPIHKGMNKNEAVVIRLAKCKDEKDLSSVIRVLFSVIESSDMSKLEQLNQILGTPALEKPTKSAEVMDTLNKAIELKPNFFGLGINFNYLLQKITESVLARKKPK